MLLSLPSAAVVLAIGNVAFEVPVTLMMVIILLLSAYALAGFGAVIGFWSPTSQVASLLTQILQTVITSFGPIYIALSQLPRPLQWVAHLWPTTYSAEALRGATEGQAFSHYALPLGILCGFVLASLILVPMRVSWRAR